MKIVELSMRKPVTVTMITVAALLFGIVSLSRLPLNLLPEISYPTLTIRTEYADAAPAEVEKLITEPLEEAVSVVPGLRRVRSESRSGVSEIYLEFAWKTDMDYAALDVREKIDLINLPDDALSPTLLRYDPSLDPIIRIGLYGEKDLVTLRFLGERLLKKDLESLEGVASVRVRGGLKEQIHVDVDDGKLAALNIPITTVSQFLTNQNVNAAGGRLRDREAEFLVRTLNEFGSADEIEEAVLFEEEGRRIRLGDVATVTRGFKEREMISRVQGKDAVELALFKEGNANTVRVARAVKNRLRKLNESLPAGVRAELLFDQSVFIESSINDVKSNAVIGGILAVLILYLFLKERRSTAIISLVIPVSIVATFFVMQQFKVSLNIMSLGGLALGVGMLVDNAIVVLEAIHRHRARGLDPWDATLTGATEVSRAVTASTLTTVAVFLPIIFVEGIAGQIFRDQALTVTASLLVSLVAALTLIPVMASFASRRKEHAGAAENEPLETEAPARTAPNRRRAAPGLPLRFFRILYFPFRRPVRIAAFLLKWLGRFLVVLLPGLLLRFGRLAGRLLLRGLDIVLRPVQVLFDASWERTAAVYPVILAGALARPGRSIAIALFLAALGAALIPTLGVELVPPFTQGEFAFRIELPPGTPLASTENAVAAVERSIAGDERVAVFFTTVGESPELGSTRSERRENVAQINVAVFRREDRSGEAEVIESIREAIESRPDMEYTFRRPSYFSFKTPVEIDVFGYDLDALGRYASLLAAKLSTKEGFYDVRSSLEEGSPEVLVRFRRDRMAALDLDLESVSQTLRNKIRGDVATRLKEKDRQIDILVRTANAATLDLEDVENLVVSQVDGIPIPLSSVADIRLGRGPSQITHIGQQRAAVIRANLSGRDLGSASREIGALLAEYPPPRSLEASLGGQNEEISTSFRSLLLAAFLAVFMVYLVMASQFESFLHPFVILLTVPLGMVGVVFALFLTGTAISIVVLIGAVMLTGIVVNNAIVLIDFINQRRRAGRVKRDAILDGAKARLRPILMTTLTTVLGLLPMATGLGEGAEIRAPMAIAVIGGLLLSTLLTLVVIPVVYSTLDKRPMAR